MSRSIPSGDPRIAVAYLRVSTEEQQLGPEAQRAAIEVWAQREGATIVAWHSDAGLSGASEIADRPALSAALADLRERGAGTLIVAKRDRIAREATIAGTVDRLAARDGARVLSADGVGNGDTASDQFMRTILDAAAAFELAQIRARTKAALAAKRSRGERIGRIPRGMRLAADGRHLEPDEGERRTLARAAELRAAGASFGRIARQLADEGHRTRAGKAFHRADIHRMLRRASTAYGSAPRVA